MDKFVVVRIFFKGDAETHSVQFFDTYNEAQTRFYSQGLMTDCKVFDRR